jgi:tRNA(fMet)-specific endonuclease VapC
MSSSLLLDTSAVISHLRPNDSVTEKLTAADFLFLPVIALGELLHGAYRLSFPERQLQKIRTFLRAVTVLGVSTLTAEHFGKISAELSVTGQMIPANDIWIAALAREYQLPVATHDVHFTRVDGISVLRW